MSATKPLEECPTHVPGWVLTVNGVALPPETVWKAESKFGSIENRVVVDPDGKPVFDRPEYREAPNVNLVAYGWDEKAGKIRIAVIRQPRPHADYPENDEGSPLVVFGQTPMGFIGKIFGEEIPQGEDGRTAAGRQAQEETGARVILHVTQPRLPYHNPNPTFVPTWSELYFVEVDLAQISKLRSQRSEPIFSAEFIDSAELFARIRDGMDTHGALYRMCTSNSVWMIFFATFPEFLPR